MTPTDWNTYLAGHAAGTAGAPATDKHGPHYAQGITEAHTRAAAKEANR